MLLVGGLQGHVWCKFSATYRLPCSCIFIHGCAHHPTEPCRTRCSSLQDPDGMAVTSSQNRLSAFWRTEQGRLKRRKVCLLFLAAVVFIAAVVGFVVGMCTFSADPGLSSDNGGCCIWRRIDWQQRGAIGWWYTTSLRNGRRGVHMTRTHVWERGYLPPPSS